MRPYRGGKGPGGKARGKEVIERGRDRDLGRERDRDLGRPSDQEGHKPLKGLRKTFERTSKGFTQALKRLLRPW